MVGTRRDEERAAFGQRCLYALDLQYACSLEHDVDLVMLVPLLAVRLRRDKHVHAEHTDNGPGGDAFALVWHDGQLHGLNGSGRSPAVIDEVRVDASGPRSVTVPGAVRAWADLAERFGRLGLDAALEPAADLAERG